MDIKENALLIVDEELGELAVACLLMQQRIKKAMRFGDDEAQRNQLQTNAERVNDEFNDLLGAVENLASKGFPVSFDENLIRAKLSKIEYYTQHSIDNGRVEKPSTQTTNFQQAGISEKPMEAQKRYSNSVIFKIAELEYDVIWIGPEPLQKLDNPIECERVQFTVSSQLMADRILQSLNADSLAQSELKIPENLELWAQTAKAIVKDSSKSDLTESQLMNINLNAQKLENSLSTFASLLQQQTQKQREGSLHEHLNELERKVKL